MLSYLQKLFDARVLSCCLLLGGQVSSVLHAAEIVQPDFNYDMGGFIEQAREQFLEERLPGFALAIVSREGVLHMETRGNLKVSDDAPVTVDSLFRIASMSKTFAGTAAAMLVHQEQQSWDTQITELFPGLTLGNKNYSKNITLKHIASHSTGLMPHSYSNLLDDGVDYNSIKNKFNQIPSVCPPGQCYGYQNVVFSLIADVVEETTHESYEKYLEEMLFKPLGMTTASVGLEPYINSLDATAPHRKVRGRWRTTTVNEAYYSVAPASGVNASVFDMALWVRANLGAYPEILPQDFLSMTHEPVVATPRGNYFNRWQGLQKAYYAIGWRVFDYKGTRAVHHGGGVRGYRSEMVFVPDANIGMVLLFNAETKLANEVVPTFLDTLLDVAD